MVFPDYPGSLIAWLTLVAAAAAMIAGFACRQTAKVRYWRWLLGAMQYVAVVILLVILWNPCRAVLSEQRKRNTVLVLFDTSESMSVSDRGGVSRLDRALEVFNRSFQPERPDGPVYKVYGFDSRCYYAGAEHLLNRWGGRTNLHAAFSLVQKQAADSKAASTGGDGNITGILIFTDGQAEDKNVGAYGLSAGRDVRLLLVGVGSRLAQTDLAVKRIEAPAEAVLNTVFDVEATVAATNPKGPVVAVELVKDGYAVAEREIAAGRIGAGRRVRFAVAADTVGEHVISVRVGSDAEEVNKANNHRSVIVRVVDSPKLDVFLYSQVANFNIGKVRQALARDEKIDLAVGLDAIIKPAASRPGRLLAGHVKLPEERTGFYKYDLIILGPCAADEFTQEQIEGLYSFVADKGGGLIVLPGRGRYSPSRWQNKKLRALLPVFFESAERAPRLKGEPELTAEAAAGQFGDLLRLGDFRQQVAAYYKVSKKPAASTLLTAGDEPCVCVHRVGRGRVCLINADKLFTWYREDLGGGLLARLFAGLSSYAVRPGPRAAPLELFARRDSARPDRIRFDAFVRDADLMLVSDATVLLSVGGEDIRLDEVGPGHYVADVTRPESRSVTATVRAERNGVFLGEKSIVVNLPPQQQEMDDVRLDRQFLRRLADKLGGEYINLDQVDKDTAAGFKAYTQVTSTARLASVWPKWWLLCFLCAILSVNWFIRRAVGLV